MSNYEGVAVFNCNYTVEANNEFDAKDFIAEMAQEEFPDLELNNVIAITEVKD